MPEIRHYRVTQTRTVDVSANTELDALEVATLAFDGPPNREGFKLPVDRFGYARFNPEVERVEVVRR